MTRRSFQMWVAAIAGLYASFILTGLFLHWSGGRYDLFKDLVPLATALPAVILTGIYQRRTSFLQQLRSTWTLLLGAVQDSIQFTHTPDPEAEDFGSAMRNLSYFIDDFRALYKNLAEDKGGPSFYPYESLKSIQKVVSAYYLKTDHSEKQGEAARKEIVAHWHNVRMPILKEFDRLEPTYFDSPFA